MYSIFRKTWSHDHNLLIACSEYDVKRYWFQTSGRWSVRYQIHWSDTTQAETTHDCQACTISNFLTCTLECIKCAKRSHGEKFSDHRIMFTHMPACVYKHSHTHTCTPTCVCMHRHAYTHVHTHAHTHTHTHSTMGAYPRGTGSNPVEGNGHFFPSYRQLYLSFFSDTHTHTHTNAHHFVSAIHNYDKSSSFHWQLPKNKMYCKAVTSTLLQRLCTMSQLEPQSASGTCKTIANIFQRDQFVEALALMFLHCVLENVDLRATALQKHCL